MLSPFVGVSLFTNLFLATRETVGFRITITGALKGLEDQFACSAAMTVFSAVTRLTTNFFCSGSFSNFHLGKVTLCR